MMINFDCKLILFICNGFLVSLFFLVCCYRPTTSLTLANANSSCTQSNRCTKYALSRVEREKVYNC